MKTVSVCIPTYEMRGLGVPYLAQNLDMLARQTFKDFNVIISDHSADNAIKDLCASYADRLEIQYVRNEENRGNSSANVNNAIRHADGRLIKFLFQDDFLYSEKALKETIDAFGPEDGWLVSACIHTKDGVHFYRPFYPRYTENIHLGRNTISSPSVLTIRNENPLSFDENLMQRMDCDYYKRCYDRFGTPRVLDTITVVNRAGPHQISQTLITPEIADKEYLYLLSKYHLPFPNLRFFAHRAAAALLRMLYRLRSFI